jgi:hypothetical protein
VKILLLTIATVALVLAGTPRVAVATDIHDQSVRTDVNLPELGIQPVSAAYDTTFVAYYTFDDGPLCVESGWTVADLTAGAAIPFGSFGALYQGITLVQEDPCASELDCVWGFFESSPDNYTCGGFPSQPAVPKGRLPAGYIHNEVWSPAIEWTGTGAEATLRFDVYRDLPLDNLVFYTWRVRSITGGVPGEWRSRGTYYYASGRDWLRTSFLFGDLVETGAEQIQVALGVVDMYDAWVGLLGSGACHSHAPLVDDVEIIRVDTGGPQWFVHPVDLFQDNFAADGTVTGTARLDAARDILPRTSSGIRPGDSVSVYVAEPEYGLDDHQSGVAASGPAVYLHVKDVSQEKSGDAITGDPTRWPVVSMANGWTVLRFDSVRTTRGKMAKDRYCIDLNDNLFTPGDTVWFFFSARDRSGRTSYWSEHAPTPTSTSLTSLEDRAMEATCLPAAAFHGGSILYVDDTDFRGAQPFVDTALDLMGILDEVDRYDVRGASYLAGNGPGSRVVDVSSQLNCCYQTIIWNSGGLSEGLVGDGSGRPEKSPDAQMLVAFLNGESWVNGVYISGDDVAEEWARLGTPAINDLKSFMNHTLINGNHVRRVGISPLVAGEPCSPFEDGFGLDTLVAYGGCPLINDFDIIEPAGDAELGMSYHGNRNTAGAVVIQETATQSGYLVRAVLSGFSFHYIRDARSQGIPARAEHLHRILKYLDPDIPFPGSTDPRIRLTATGSGVLVGWIVDTRCNPYVGVNVYRRVDYGQERLLLNTGGPVPADQQYLDRDVKAGTTYQYRIGAVLPDESEHPSAERDILVRFRFTACDARALEAGVELTWCAEMVDPVEEFRVYRRELTDPPYPGWLPVGTQLPATASRFVDKTAKPGRRYEYYIQVVLGDHDVVESEVMAVGAPGVVGLTQNVPNPFNPATTIAYNLTENTHATIRIYDVKGGLVRTLVNDTRPPGYNETSWDGLNEAGAPAASGVYFCRLDTQGQTLTRKMVLVR